MNLYVRVIEARNVPAGDIGGTSDCYLTLSTMRTKQSLIKTSVQKKTLTPKWDEEYTLRVDYVTDTIVFGLFDHDAVGSDDQLGVMHIKVHALNPGLIEDRWWKMVPPKKKESAELHLITQIVYDGQPFGEPLNDLYIDCFVRIIEANNIINIHQSSSNFISQSRSSTINKSNNIPKMDVIGKSDPYIKLTVSSDSHEWSSTMVKDNTQEPVWNESFLFWITNPVQDKLMFKMWDKDVASDDLISTLELPLSNFKVGQKVEDWFDFVPAPKVESGGRVKMLIYLAPKGYPMPGYGRLLPSLDAIDNLAPIGMPERGWPPKYPDLPM